MKPVFFDHYLAMTAPCSRASEIERIMQGSSVDVALATASKKAVLLDDYIHGRRKTLYPPLVSILELMGATCELHQSGVLSVSQASEAESIFEKFDDLIVNLDDRPRIRLEQHLIECASAQFGGWHKYCRFADKESTGMSGFFDKNKGDQVDFLEVGDVQEFNEKARISDRYQLIMLYYDYIDYLYAREKLSRTTALAKSLGVDTCLDEDIRKADDWIKSISIPADFPLRPEIRERYRPEDFYWYYYSIPRTLMIEYG